jgi:hypothetical protein
VKATLELPGRKKVRYVRQGSGHVRSNQDKTGLENSRNLINENLTYRPIVIHILVIDGQVLKNKTYIWFENNKIVKHA